MSGEMRLIYADELAELREENKLLRKELEDERKAHHNRIVNYEAVLRELGEERERNRRSSSHDN